MRIAVVFEGNLTSGGGFQQIVNMALLLNKRNSPNRKYIFFTSNEQNKNDLLNLGIESNVIDITIIKKLIIFIRKQRRLKNILDKIGLNYSLDKYFDQFKIDLVYFTGGVGMALKLEYMNFICTVWDLCHRDHPEFPEIRENGEFEAREFVFNKVLPKAVAIIVDSETGKKNLSKYYNLSPERIFIIPFSPAVSVDRFKQNSQDNEVSISRKYNIKYPYIFYPAQFWSHKNHIYILKAIKILNENNGPKISVVFSGSEGPSFNHIINKIKFMNLEDQIHVIGFAPNHEIPHIYQQSLALVMPTWFGPTNIPPLEAFSLKVPVLYPNLPDLSLQVQNAALLFSPYQPSSLAHHLIELIKKPSLSKKLTKNGTELLNTINSNNRTDTIEKILNQFETKLDCWK
jgi:glycosyltransferase involved in cell wall biosynthesis